MHAYEYQVLSTLFANVFNSLQKLGIMKDTEGTEESCCMFHKFNT